MWRGSVVSQSRAAGRDTMLVSFDAMPQGHSHQQQELCKRQECWAWGEHWGAPPASPAEAQRAISKIHKTKRNAGPTAKKTLVKARPSQSPLELSGPRKSAQPLGGPRKSAQQLSGPRKSAQRLSGPRKSAQQQQRSKAVSGPSMRIEVARQGERAWPCEFAHCLRTLASMQGLLREAQARWLSCTASASTADVLASCEEVRTPTDDALINLDIIVMRRDLDARGFTALVDAAIRILDCVPQGAWNSRLWPMRGDWAACVSMLHTPQALYAKLRFAIEEVIRWPDDGGRDGGWRGGGGGGGSAEPAAVFVELVGGGDLAREGDLAGGGEPGGGGQPAASDDPATTDDPAATDDPCFVCGHAAHLAHPYMRGLRVCKPCRERFESAPWECDDEQIGVCCDVCAHEGAAPHGCRGCGSSMCERCLYMLGGGVALEDARWQRLEGALCCPACKCEDDAGAPERLRVRVVCDGCRLEWHPRCHVPALAKLPGGSAKWLCVQCKVLGVPQVSAWSVRTCALCNAKAPDKQESVERGADDALAIRHAVAGAGGSSSRRAGALSMVLQGIVPGARKLRFEASMVRPFDHRAAITKMNHSVDAANEALMRAPVGSLLSEHNLAALAARAAARGGLTVVSFCDGKATLLGVLLAAGVRVRRYLSIENNPAANQVAMVNYGGASQAGLAPNGLRWFDDAERIQPSDLAQLDCWPVDLLVGSTPCNDLSGCNAAATGLKGPHSHLLLRFVDFFRELARGNDGMAPAMLFENVVPSTSRARQQVLKAFKPLPALVSEGAVFEAARRPRWLVANMLFERVPLETPNKRLQDVLNPPARAIDEKASCIIGSAINGSNESVASARAHSKRNRGRQLVLCASHSIKTRGLTVPETARCLGQSCWEVDSAPGGEWVGRGLLGRSIAVGMIRHALGGIVRAVVAAQEGVPAAST